MKADFINLLQAAVEKNLSLGSATYYKKIDNSVFDNKNRFSEGVFVALENGTYNWAQTHYLGEEDQYSKMVGIDGTLYTFFSFAVEDRNGWEKFEEEIYDFKEIIYPLLEHTLVEEFIEEIRVEENGDSHYYIDLSDTYIEYLKLEAIEGLEAGALELDNSEVEFIRAVKNQIESIRNRTYHDSKVEIVMNTDGYLVQFKESYTYRDSTTAPDEITIYLDYQLKDYNLSNPMRLFPVIKDN